jgi:hypothetical protein
MKKSMVIAACGLACVASVAFAQVGLGGGVVGTLGANGAASSVGGLGSGISTGASARGADLRSSGQIGTTAQTPAARSSTSNAIDAKANGNGIRADTGAGGSASTPIVSGSSWGSAQSGAQVSGPDVKNTAKNKVEKLEDRRDQIEERGDKTIDKL